MLFRSPFINRIDNVIIFNKLKKDDITYLINKKVNKLKNKYKNRIKISINKNVINEILEESNYNEFGARRIDKIIKDNLENKIINSIIEEKSSIHIKSIKKLVTT